MVRAIERVPIKREKLGVNPKKVGITSSNLDLATSLKRELMDLGISARLIEKPQSLDADMVILTEGTNAQQTLLSRHWDVLKSCKSLRDSGIPIVLLGQYDNEDISGLSGLAGLSRTLRQEWPEASIASLEISARSTPKQIARSLLNSYSEAQLKNGKLSTIRVADAPLPPPAPETQSASGNWLITGGARGVTAACAVRLAQRIGSGKFFLAGRSAPLQWPASVPDCADLLSLRGALIQHTKQNGERPRLPEIDQQARSLLAGRDVRETLRKLADAGIEAHYVQIDVSKRKSVQTALAKLTKAHGPITGLVHGAGVLADRQAIKKTKADVSKVFAPKVDGLINILEAVNISDLTHCALFSSAAAVFGNPGQSDYAMANAWLNRVAEHLHATRPGLRVKSFCWGPWAGGMVDDTLASHFADRGISLIELENGADIFANHLLYGDDDPVNLLIGDRW